MADYNLRMYWTSRVCDREDQEEEEFHSFINDMEAIAEDVPPSYREEPELIPLQIDFLITVMKLENPEWGAFA